jgi:hypothetical protein
MIEPYILFRFDFPVTVVVVVISHIIELGEGLVFESFLTGPSSVVGVVLYVPGSLLIVGLSTHFSRLNDVLVKLIQVLAVTVFVEGSVKVLIQSVLSVVVGLIGTEELFDGEDSGEKIDGVAHG